MWQAAAELGWTPGAGEPTETLAAEIGRRLSPARGRPAGEAEQILLPHRDQIRVWLKPPAGQKRGLQLTKVHQLLGRRGVVVPYSSLHRFAMKHCRRITVRMADTEAGEVAEIDFGRLGLVWDPVTERRRMLWALGLSAARVSGKSSSAMAEQAYKTTTAPTLFCSRRNLKLPPRLV